MAVVCIDGQSEVATSTHHAVVIPLYGDCPSHFTQQVCSFARSGLRVVLVQNNPKTSSAFPPSLQALVDRDTLVNCIFNGNQGGVAGGFNRGIELAIALGVQWITLLDQDSCLQPEDIERLVEPWSTLPGMSLLVGPLIWDGRRQELHGRHRFRQYNGYLQTRLLISSGTTFRASDWPSLGPMCEWLFVDYVDHFWCFRAQARGFLLLQNPRVRLVQAFGHRHPNLLCRLVGMELYSPMRHFYSLRNLRLLLLNKQVPLDLRLKEFTKMLLKPWLWLFFEPCRSENLKAILKALRSPLPVDLSFN